MKKLLFGLALLLAVPAQARITTILTLPAGSDTEIQFNDSGLFGSSGTFTYDKATDLLTVSSITLTNITWGDGTIQTSSPTASILLARLSISTLMVLRVSCTTVP